MYVYLWIVRDAIYSCLEQDRSIVNADIYVYTGRTEEKLNENVYIYLFVSVLRVGQKVK